MAKMKNWNVGGGLSDFWAYIREPRPHRWTSWGLAIVVSGIVFVGFSDNLFPYHKPKPQIIYFENWTKERNESQIRADWVARAKETTRKNAKLRAEYQRLADMLGVSYDSTEADRITRETLGAKEAEELQKKPEPPKRSNIAERAARGPQGKAKGGR